eukprot:TRINITY_DN68187_c0_g1_i1.p3 TRINITY_DN68187_c0_g1~~TRINITY_DN68187_c0_g1_i1.p3  ORF type:complete len:106 (-),score=41.33 TRINITY_DN68187_c0_g1_i1:58-375(-)
MQESDALAEAEAMLEGEGAEAAEGKFDDDGGEDLGGGQNDVDASTTEPVFAIGQALRAQQADGGWKKCEVVAADKTELGPMYAVKFEDGHVQSLVAEDQLQAGTD